MAPSDASPDRQRRRGLCPGSEVERFRGLRHLKPSERGWWRRCTLGAAETMSSQEEARMTRAVLQILAATVAVVTLAAGGWWTPRAEAQALKLGVVDVQRVLARS